MGERACVNAADRETKKKVGGGSQGFRFFKSAPSLLCKALTASSYKIF
jgi:hypothetical protein